MRILNSIRTRFRKLFQKEDDTFVVNLWVNIPTGPKVKKPYAPKQRYIQRSLFDYQNEP